jgi:hypothetical protein
VLDVMLGALRPREAGIDTRRASQWNEDAMKSTRPPDPAPRRAVPTAPASRSRPVAEEDRDWRASSLDLAGGLEVVEFADTLPAEFRELA